MDGDILTKQAKKSYLWRLLDGLVLGVVIGGGGTLVSLVIQEWWDSAKKYPETVVKMDNAMAEISNYNEELESRVAYLEDLLTRKNQETVEVAAEAVASDEWGSYEPEYLYQLDPIPEIVVEEYKQIPDEVYETLSDGSAGFGGVGSTPPMPAPMPVPEPLPEPIIPEPVQEIAREPQIQMQQRVLPPRYEPNFKR